MAKMKTKHETLIDLLKSVPIALKYYIESGVCRYEEYMWYEVLDGKLDILEVFGEESEAQETVELIRALIASIDKAGDGIWLLDFPSKVDKLEKKIEKSIAALIRKIEKA